MGHGNIVMFLTKSIFCEVFLAASKINESTRLAKKLNRLKIGGRRFVQCALFLVRI